jgi:hypothetical protein
MFNGPEGEGGSAVICCGRVWLEMGVQGMITSLYASLNYTSVSVKVALFEKEDIRVRCISTGMLLVSG